MEKARIQSILESLLLVQGDPIGVKKLSEIIGVKKKEVQEALDDLSREYQDNQKGWQLIQQNNKVQLTTVSQNSSYVERLVKVEKEAALSPAARETLAIIAYKGPLTRSQIDLIRGVNSAFILRNLLIRGLIEKTSSRSKLKGNVYKVSAEFLKGLGVSRVEELPDYEKLNQSEEMEKAFKEN